MSGSTTNILELNRTFLHVPESSIGPDAEAVMRASLIMSRREDWNTLLAKPYVVVLGEAGTGKSTEFQLRTQSLVDAGGFAFFVEISDLAADGLAASIDVEDTARMSARRTAEADGVFFLDSLDEAKLKDHTLRQALRKLRRELSSEWDRVRLVVSCRATDWMPDSDRDEVHNVIADEKSDVHIVQLAPLNSDQVERLAGLVGVANVAEFTTAIEDSYAQAFVERPLDVKWLGSYWVRHGRIGNLRELIADNVREKLRERPGRNSTLSLKKAVAGIETLAGVGMINNSWSFLVPDDSLHARRAASTIDPVTQTAIPITCWPPA